MIFEFRYIFFNIDAHSLAAARIGYTVRSGYLKEDLIKRRKLKRLLQRANNSETGKF